MGVDLSRTAPCRPYARHRRGIAGTFVGWDSV